MSQPLRCSPFYCLPKTLGPCAIRSSYHDGPRQEGLLPGLLTLGDSLRDRGHRFRRALGRPPFTHTPTFALLAFQIHCSTFAQKKGHFPARVIDHQEGRFSDNTYCAARVFLSREGRKKRGPGVGHGNTASWLGHEGNEDPLKKTFSFPFLVFGSFPILQRKPLFVSCSFPCSFPFVSCFPPIGAKLETNASNRAHIPSRSFRNHPSSLPASPTSRQCP